MKGLTKTGGHSDVQRAGMEDLQAISTVLGDEKSYILGDRPSDVDCTLFGFMCLILQDDSIGGDQQASSKNATSVYKECSIISALSSTNNAVWNGLDNPSIF